MSCHNQTKLSSEVLGDYPGEIEGGNSCGEHPRGILHSFPVAKLSIYTAHVDSTERGYASSPTALRIIVVFDYQLPVLPSLHHYLQVLLMQACATHSLPA